MHPFSVTVAAFWASSNLIILFHFQEIIFLYLIYLVNYIASLNLTMSQGVACGGRACPKPLRPAHPQALGPRLHPDARAYVLAPTTLLLTTPIGNPFLANSISLQLEKYIDELYPRLPPSPSWSRAATDHLYALVQEYDQRWVIIQVHSGSFDTCHPLSSPSLTHLQ